MKRALWMGFFRVMTRREVRMEVKATPRKISHWNKFITFSAIIL